MATYILLRNKVESKALSLEELRAMGLRSTYLIWVECQSWDWQRPQEIHELKMLLGEKTQPVAPAVEPTPVIANEPVKPLSKIKVAQTVLPDENLDDAVEKQTPVAIPEPDMDMYKYGGISAATATIKEETSTKLDNTAIIQQPETPTGKQENAPSLQTNYSRSLDEIKELYVQNLAKQGKLGRTKKNWSPKEFKKVALYIGFAAVGAIMMLVFGNTGHKKRNASLPATQASPANQAKQDVGLTEPASLQEQIDQSKITADNNAAPVTIAHKQQADEKSIPGASEERPIAEPPAKPAPVESNVLIPDEKSSKKVNENKPVTGDLSSQLSVSANKYVTGSFGGIRDLEMTLQNDSKYLLDAVTVELKYLNLDGIMVNKEIILFHAVQPGQPATVAVKKSRRGMKVAWKITRVESKEASKDIAGF